MTTSSAAAEKPIPDYLAKLHAHERDPFIEFDPVPHLYTVKGEGGYTSVTTWNHSHFSHFDADTVAENIVANKTNMSRPSYKYYGMTKDEIKALWAKTGEEASGAGTNMHYDIECYWNQVPVSNDSTEYAYFLKFVEDFKRENPGTIPYRTEWMVYYEELKLSGSIDMVFQNPDGTLQIYDWKRCKEIPHENPYGKTALTECIKHMPDAKFWHYSLQLNTYKTILESKYGKHVSKLCLVCLHPDNPYRTYDRIEVPILEEEMRNLFEFRRRSIQEVR